LKQIPVLTKVGASSHRANSAAAVLYNIMRLEDVSADYNIEEDVTLEPDELLARKP